MASYGQVRIISGKWKGRKIRFPAAKGLRPSLRRNRETLFNWIRPEIAGARCLDLFAGSGILGFEAASLQAKSVDFIDSNREVVRALRENLTVLKDNSDGPKMEIYLTDSIRWLKQATEPYDIIFLDPPYTEPALLKSALKSIETQQLCGGLVYAESNAKESLITQCETTGFEVLRSVRAGDSFAILASPINR